MAIQYFKTLGVFVFFSPFFVFHFDITERFSNSLDSKYQYKINQQVKKTKQWGGRNKHEGTQERVEENRTAPRNIDAFLQRLLFFVPFLFQSEVPYRVAGEEKVLMCATAHTTNTTHFIVPSFKV